MTMKKTLTILAIAVSFAAQAQQLQVSTGGAQNTYSKMFKQLAERCGGVTPLIEVNSTGSNENIDRLVGNEVNAAFVQSDVLYLRARTEELGNVKTLVALHPEQVHIVTRASSGIKEGGTLGIGAKEVVFTDLTSLAGRRVGAAGGSLMTAQVIRLQSEVSYTVHPFDKDADVLKSLEGGAIDAAILVGGAPLGSVAALGPQFKLLSVAPATVEKLKGVYKPAVLNYAKMNSRGISTVATEALFVTREYKTDKMVQGLSKLRTCFNNNLSDLKETTNTHPAWQKVEANNRGKWAWYDLPAGK